MAGAQLERHDRPYPGARRSPTRPAGSFPACRTSRTRTAILQYDELDYVVWPWFVPGVRTEYTHTTVEGASDAQLLRIIPGIAMLARPNIRVVFTGDLEWAKNLPAVGSWATRGRAFSRSDDTSPSSRRSRST